MLYLVTTDREYTQYILEPLRERSDIRIVTYKEKKRCGLMHIFNSLAKYVRTSLLPVRGLFSSFLFEKDFLKALHEVGPNDHVLIFTIFNLKTQILIKQESRVKEMDVYLFDSVRSFKQSLKSRKNHLSLPAKNHLNIYTFDSYDAANFGFKQIEAVSRDPHLGHPSQQVEGVFYCGATKGRSAFLKQIIEDLTRQNVAIDFRIFRSKHDALEQELAQYYMAQPIPYEEMLNQLNKYTCVLEINLDIQEGYTLRVLEALFMDKKLITNNKKLLEAPFYHPDNVYVIGYDDRTIAEFVAKPFHPIDEDIKNRYRIEKWIAHFIPESNENCIC